MGTPAAEWLLEELKQFGVEIAKGEKEAAVVEKCELQKGFKKAGMGRSNLGGLEQWRCGLAAVA